MQPLKMGGKELLRIFLKGNEDLTGSLLSREEGGRALDRSLRDLIAEKYGGSVKVEVFHEACGRSELLLQQLDGMSPPKDWRAIGLGDAANGVMAECESRVFEESMDVLVLSLQPEITHSLWRHRQSGYLIYPHPSWERQWPPAWHQWFREQFSPVGLLQVDQFTDNYLRLIRAIKARLDVHILVYNCSSFDPNDRTHNYYGHDDTLALRIHKFNLALMKLSALEGISIIDVDRLLAELGAERHTLGALRYSPAAHQVICREFLRVLEDIGFFESRPLIIQLGQPRASR
ncbi:MAG TPA: hypothetical protein VN648_25745 [Candidatus Methylomirabilis sp.]|nr:hypothetical protein [Candidatus Methylomirabilis sp.]